MDFLLNPEFCVKLRETINRTDIFVKDKEESRYFSLVCAFMDRFDTAIKYINEHLDRPNNESELMLFMNYACIIKDGINYMCKILNICSNEDEKIFANTYRKEPLNIPFNIDYSDDKFFEYMRALIFAHPFLTDRAIPNRIENEIQYSPHTVFGTWSRDDLLSPVGAMVYSNKKTEFYSVVMSFDDLKAYLKSKYLKIFDIIQKFEDIISNKESIWKKHKVNRNQDDVQILKDCVEIIKERYMETSEFEELITYLTCHNSLEENRTNVESYRNYIKGRIPIICDALDDYNMDEVYNEVSSILYSRPKAHPMMHYQLEKIFCDLDYEHGDIRWGLIQAEAFSKEFAKKWVVIKPEEMTFDEIKLLANVACYLEYKEQNGV